MNHIDLNLVRKYDVPGPRYTSYPTALQFRELSASDYAGAIAASAFRERDLSLYFHIPFCSTLCFYCACNKVVTKNKSRAEPYLRQLYREMELKAALLPQRNVVQVHLGGGTPTFLSDEQIRTLMDKARAHFRFRNDAEGEFGIEIDPRTVDAGRIRALRTAGFNRLSLGIQDFEPAVQKAVNRRQSFEATRSVMQAARASGFRSISVDLIYGLPQQSVESVGRTLDQVLELGPDRISIYNYAHLPERFMPQQRIKAEELPNPEIKLRILKRCIDTLTHGGGYSYIGMDHFARPEDDLAAAQREGTLHRNFQGYSTLADRDLIAFGITAISSIGNTYAQNVKQLEEYERLLGRGELPVEKGIAIDRDDLIRKAVIMALICQFSLDYSMIETKFGISFTDYFSEEIACLARFADDGLLEIGDAHIQVNETGRLFIRNICMCFDRHLAQSAGRRFSRAI